MPIFNDLRNELKQQCLNHQKIIVNIKVSSLQISVLSTLSSEEKERIAWKFTYILEQFNPEEIIIDFNDPKPNDNDTPDLSFSDLLRNLLTTTDHRYDDAYYDDAYLVGRYLLLGLKNYLLTSIDFISHTEHETSVIDPAFLEKIKEDSKNLYYRYKQEITSIINLKKLSIINGAEFSNFFIVYEIDNFITSLMTALYIDLEDKDFRKYPTYWLAYPQLRELNFANNKLGNKRDLNYFLIPMIEPHDKIGRDDGQTDDEKYIKIQVHPKHNIFRFLTSLDLSQNAIHYSNTNIYPAWLAIAKNFSCKITA